MKTVKPHRGQSADEVSANADHEYEKMREAWEGGVSHTVEPLGVYHASPQQAPRSFGMYHSGSPPIPESFIVMR